jgi:Domain of unknown function (DUF4124)
MNYSSKGKPMLRHLPVVWTLLVFATASPAADTQDIYKWTNDQGEVQYTQFPPPGRPAEILHGALPPAQSSETAGNDLQKQVETMDKQNEEQLQGAKDAKQWAEIQKIRRSNCETANKNLVNLQRGGNVRYLGPKGEVIRLTEEERQKRIDEANKQIKENCNP